MTSSGRTRDVINPHCVNVGYSAANYYLLRTDSAGMLVDVGWPGTLLRLRGTLTRAGSDIQAVTHLLCTHYHPDHAGLPEELKRLGVRLLVFETQSDATVAMCEYLKAKPQSVPVSGRGMVEVGLGGSRMLLAGLGIPGEVVSTTGHTDDSVSLVLDGGLAFTGDLPPPMIGEPGSVIRQSWAKLRALGVQKVLPGHGPSGAVPV
jgi:glyoxylase-like metal-dependent hydrolase (beta-lactamase superfamily II)